MNTHSDVGVLVVTFNSGEVIDRCLAALSPLSVTVVDNGSIDSTTERIARADNARLVSNRSNTGFAAAVNLGLALLDGQDVLVVNPDVVAPCSQVEALHDQLARSPKVGIIAPRLVGTDGEIQFSARTFQTPATILARRTTRVFAKRRQALLEKHLAPSAGAADHNVPWVLGAAMMVRRAAIASVGGMDERFFLYYEDQDWCIRMWHAGWHVRLFPQVVMHHDYQRASRKSVSRAAWYHAASAARFYRKYPGLLVGKSPLASTSPAGGL